jgi:hypothetical protein
MPKRNNQQKKQHHVPVSAPKRNVKKGEIVQEPDLAKSFAFVKLFDDRECQNKTVDTGAGDSVKSWANWAAMQKEPTKIHYNPNPSVEMHSSGMYASLFPMIPIQDCKTLIEKSETFQDWCDNKDSVDGKSEWQHTILDVGKGIRDPILLPLCEKITQNAIVKTFAAFGADTSSLRMHWAFIRKYDHANHFIGVC